MDDLKYQVDLLKALNEKLMASEHIYRTVSEFSGLLYVYKDYRNQRVELIGPWDDVLKEKIVGLPYDERYMLNMIHEDDMKTYTETIFEMERHQKTHGMLELRTKTTVTWAECEAKINYDDAGNPIEKVIAFRDISKRKAQSEDITYLAFNDSLTGLYNRNYFVRCLRDFCERAESEKVGVEVLFLDIDNFKKINDSIGLLFGDELVQGFAAMLKEFCSEDILVGRFGSDVFILAIYNPCGQRSADYIYKTVQEKLREPFVLTNKTAISYTVSAGVAEYPEAGATALELIKNTEIVLSRAKESGKNNIQYFEYDILHQFIKHVSLEQKLKDAIDNEDFTLYFQPQFDSKTKQLRGAEALLRWPDANGSFITSPSEFIPLAEKNGAIVPIGRWVLKESIKLMNNWRMRFRMPFIISVNISAIQIEKDDFLDYIHSLLDLYDFDPRSLELEITETTFINDFETMKEKIGLLRKQGIKVSLDDFGTGYSSLSYLKGIPIDSLKIDKTFIDSALSDASSNIITRTVVEMAGKLGIVTIAEGVESESQLSYMREIGCDYVQGFLLGKPMSRHDFEKLIIRQLP